MTCRCGRPADLQPIPLPGPGSADTPATTEPVSWPDAIEVDLVVPASGNMTVGPQQFWLGPAPRRAAGQVLDRYRHRAPEHRRVAGQDRAVPADRRGPGPAAPVRGPPGPGPPPGGPAPGALAAAAAWKADRLVNATGGITLGNQLIPVGSPLAGQRGPDPPRWPADARDHPGRRAMAVLALSHPAGSAAPAARVSAWPARPAAGSRPRRAAVGLLPGRHPGRHDPPCTCPKAGTASANGFYLLGGLWPPAATP